jgi:hypothetical protein
MVFLLLLLLRLLLLLLLLLLFFTTTSQSHSQNPIPSQITHCLCVCVFVCLFTLLPDTTSQALTRPSLLVLPTPQSSFSFTATTITLSNKQRSQSNKRISQAHNQNPMPQSGETMISIKQEIHLPSSSQAPSSKLNATTWTNKMFTNKTFIYQDHSKLHHQNPMPQSGQATIALNQTRENLPSSQAPSQAPSSKTQYHKSNTTISYDTQKTNSKFPISDVVTQLKDPTPLLPFPTNPNTKTKLITKNNKLLQIPKFQNQNSIATNNIQIWRKE